MTRSRAQEVIWPALVLVTGGILIALTWGRWTEILVDFGREVYTAWRLAEGDVLYDDIAYFSGPLSPNLNALWFRLFRPGIWVLLTMNGLLLALLMVISYTILQRLTAPAPAAIACISFLLLCAFSHYSTYGSFNFLAPYSHELTHGLVLTGVGLLFLRRLAIGHPASALGVGFCSGLALLTKPEMALASVGAIGLGVTLSLAGNDLFQVGRKRALVWFGSGLVLPLLWYAMSVPPPITHHLFSALVSPWTAVANGEVRGLLFYQAGLGLDRPGRNLLWMGVWCGIWGVLVGAPSLIASRLQGRLRKLRGTGLVAFGLTVPLSLVAVITAEPFRAFGPLLPMTIFLLVAHTRARPPGSDRKAWGNWVLGTSALAFSLLLLLKMGLRPQMRWYGFALAGPALMASVAWILDPRSGRGTGSAGGRHARIGAAAAVLISVTGFHLAATYFQLSKRTLPVGEGRDRIMTDEARGVAIASALDGLRERKEGPSTLLVVPEGVMINYLVRMRSPTPFINLMPPELIIFGEEAIEAALNAHPPDFVLEVPKPGNDLGAEFGTGFGRSIKRWIDRQYLESDAFSGGDFLGERFIVRLLTAHPPPGPTAGRQPDSPPP